MRLSEAAQDRRHHGANNIVRDAETHLAGKVDSPHLIHDFIVERDQAMSLDKQLLALARQAGSVGLSIE